MQQVNPSETLPCRLATLILLIGYYVVGFITTAKLQIFDWASNSAFESLSCAWTDSFWGLLSSLR